MYRGNLPQPTGTSHYPGSAGWADVTTALQCREVFERCVSEGRFPGEHIPFKSHSGIHGPLLEVIQECAGMREFVCASDADGGYIMYTSEDIVVGFVAPSIVKDGRETPALGVAYIGG
jgi:hypothetical protein